jgi:hypothetical protein
LTVREELFDVCGDRGVQANPRSLIPVVAPGLCDSGGDDRDQNHGSAEDKRAPAIEQLGAISATDPPRIEPEQCAP